MIGQKLLLPECLQGFSIAKIRKTAPPRPGSHVIQLKGTIFELNSHIKKTNVLTKFHENWAKNVTSRVFTCFHYIYIEKNAPLAGGHVFSPIWTIFKLVRDINTTNVLTNFHDDWAKIVTSRVFTSHVIQLKGTIFELNSHIKKTNVLTKFHENWAKNVTSKVFTCFHYIHIEKNAPLAGGHVFSPICTIFKLVRDINKTNVLTNFHDDWAKIVTSRVFTSHINILAGTIFELNSHIKETNVLTKFHENWAKNVNSIVFTCFHYIHIEKNAPPTGGHVFLPIWTIFKLVRDINKTNVLTNFHDDWAKIVTSRPCYSTDRTIFELNSHIKETNVLTKFHENWAKNVTSRVFTCFHYIHIEKNVPPTGSHVFSPIWTIFKLVRDINKTNVLTNFHDDWAKLVTSRVFTSHVIQLKGTIFELNSHIKKTNVLTKFHENWAKNVTSRVFTCVHYIHIEKNAPLAGGHVFSPIWTIFKLVQDINKTNVLTNVHDDWAKIVTSRVFTSHINIWAGTIFELNSHIKETNVLTKFHENWAKNVNSRVFTCFHYIHIEKNAPPTGGHVFLPIWTIFKLVRDINKTNVLTNFHDDWAKIVTSRPKKENCPPPRQPCYSTDRTIFELNSHIKETNVLTKFHENWAKNVTSRVFTCFHYIHIEKNVPPTGSHVFSPIWTIFKLVRDINKTNVLTNFHDDWAKIATSRVFSSHVIQLKGTIFELNSHIKKTNVLTKFHENWAKNVTSRVFTCFHYIHIEKNAPLAGGHVFSPIWTIFKLVRDINKTNVLTNFHDDWAKIVTSRVFTSHINIWTGTIFELNSHIKETNVLTTFHENWAKNVNSRVFTCFHYIHIEKNAPPTGGHVFLPIWTIFKLVRDINKTNVLTNFHDDWAKIVTSRVFTRKTAPPPPRQPCYSTDRTIFELNSHIKETNVLTKFHDNWAKNVTSRVFTCFHYIHIEKNVPPTGSHVFSPIWTIFKLV
ncbi:hypothetical protein DPMN_053928 [Dreissena polymorpha]|uniref:Uncharacterized protein n=1 Tax=Dreissena polymorpha TaxID=45954 RepID=A0A9D4CN23_DREPO|nr:hypothetical protein DPMN_053928 [Dreissena polymorpha]